MLNISIAEDCTNTLKKRYVRDFNVDCVTGRIADALEKLSDDVRWDVIGLREMTNKSEIADSLRSMSRDNIKAFSLENALAQDSRVIANGVIELKNGSSVHFCDIYVFESQGAYAKIKTITTYGVTVKR